MREIFKRFYSINADVENDSLKIRNWTGMARMSYACSLLYTKTMSGA